MNRKEVVRTLGEVSLCSTLGKAVYVGIDVIWELENRQQKILKLISHSVRNAAEIARLKAEIDTLKGEKYAT